VRVLVFHGYLLQGTGSNVYNARLGEALVRAGHEVHLVCQDRSPFDLDWVDAMGDWEEGTLRTEVRSEHVRATVYRPDIGHVLPVYVADRYDGVEAKPFPDLTEAELERYLDANVEAVRQVADFAKPDVALANHLVMGPAILARALPDVPYAVKIHGSALEYTVKPHPRFRPYAQEGLARARGVLVGSRHTAESLWAEMADDTLPGRTRLGPPGVDVDRFAPREPGAAAAGMGELVERLATTPASGAGSFARDPAEAVEALSRLDPAQERLVVYVGKLIASKGVELLLAAWPLVLEREPAARLVIVGFGGFRDGLRQLADDLARGDLEAARATRGEDGSELPSLAAFLDALPDPAGYRAAAAGLADTVVWTGRLEHAEMADLLPAAEAIVVPSTFPEAFGMVAAEGAACGALPVVAGHSGLAEVSAALAEALPPAAQDLLTFEVGPDAVAQLGEALSGWLAAPEDVREATRREIVRVVRERWSWDGVAQAVVAAARGELDALPHPS
jgi:glycosyltransferase involved in cell wall biosynthesis